jgi:acetate kinase
MKFMGANENTILSINGGSSSFKFSLYRADQYFTPLLHGQVENIASGKSILHYSVSDHVSDSIAIPASEQHDIIKFFIGWLEKQEGFAYVKAIGHRIVHGMKHTKPERITPEFLDELKKIILYDTEHLPAEIKMIEVFKTKFPALIQIACFDTSFHTSMPVVSKLLPIPRRYYENGIQRYGFHGLSYSYLMDQLTKLSGSTIINEKIILAHLGNGASLAAIKDGKSFDTSMGFTPTGGIPMSTRTGDLDPGVAAYLMQHEKLTPPKFNHLINHESGLFGISETNSDMRGLLKLRATDIRAAEAIELFCYQTKKWIGAFAAALGGLDTIVFSGGIGENSFEVREKICTGLEFLGIELDVLKNKINDAVISSAKSKITVRVIKTNEELMIAKLVCSMLNSP